MAENNHINVKSNSFKIPTKCVKNAQDITVWEKSEAYQVTIHCLLFLQHLLYGSDILSIDFMLFLLGISWFYFCNRRCYKRKKDSRC